MVWRYFVFFLIFLSVFGGAHLLVGTRIVSLFGLSGWARIGLWCGLASLGAMAVVAQVVARTAGGGDLWRDALIWGGMVWMGFLMLAFFAAVAGDLVGLAGCLLPERFAVGVKIVRGALLGLAFVGGVWAIVSARLPPRIHDVVVHVDGLPRAFDGYRIAHITDTHVGPILRRAWVEDLVGRVDSAKPDLVVHTGDLVDGSVARLAQVVEPFSRLGAKDGVYFVTGNHESYSGAKEWSDHAGRIGFRVLLNSHSVVSRDGGDLVVAGVTDHREGGFLPERAPDAARAFTGAPDGFRLLLAHQPVQASAAQGLGVGLQLSGHTHGGQIWPFHLLVRLAQPVVSGFGQVGDVRVFVSNGAGFWGPPMRLFARSEVPILVLRRRA